MRSNSKLLKLFGAFFAYFLYSAYISTLLGKIDMENNIIARVFCDILFMVLVFLLYRQNLKEDWKKLKKMPASKIIKNIIMWLIILFGVNILSGVIAKLLAPNYVIDANTKQVYNLYGKDTWYAIFRLMIFSTFVESIMWQEAIHDNVKDKTMFVVIASAIGVVMNFVFNGLPSEYALLQVFAYFLPAAVLAIAYLKNDCNVFIMFFIKMLFNLLPLILLVLGV